MTATPPHRSQTGRRTPSRPGRTAVRRATSMSSPTLTAVSLRPSSRAAAPPPVAAYGFEEGAGTAIGDASGNGNRHDQRGDLDEHRQVRQGARLQRHQQLRRSGQPAVAADHGLDDLERVGFATRTRPTTARSWPSRAAAAGRAAGSSRAAPTRAHTPSGSAFPSTAAATCSGTARRCVSSTPATTSPASTTRSKHWTSTSTGCSTTASCAAPFPPPSSTPTRT